MSRRRELLDVGVHSGILWIGAAAYPLRNIARVQVVEVRPDRARAVRRFVLQAFAWTGIVAVAAIRSAGLSPSDQATSGSFGALVWFVLMTVSLIRLLVIVGGGPTSPRSSRPLAVRAPRW
jgi:Family of unknown function (DUF6232)